MERFIEIYDSHCSYMCRYIPTDTWHFTRIYQIISFLILISWSKKQKLYLMTILQKKSARWDGFFETNLDFINHPLQDFWNCPPTFPQYFQIFSQISIFGEFRYLCLKFGTFSINIHGEKCFQSCTLFGSFVNFPIVQCML